MAMSPAQRVMARKQAALAAGERAVAPGGAVAGIERQVAGRSPLRAATASAYQLQLAALGERLRELKQIQSIELKIARKREIIADFDPWVQGILDAYRNGTAAKQDDVLLVQMVWALDIEDYERALPLVEYVLTNDLALPERYTRTAPTLIAEESANAALAHLVQGEPVNLTWLQLVEDMTAESDMHDQVRAKLHKAIGLALLLPTSDPETGAGSERAGGTRAQARAALPYLKRALQLNGKVGVKEDIRRVLRTLEKADAAAEGAA